MGEGHIPCVGLKDLVRVVKPGEGEWRGSGGGGVGQPGEGGRAREIEGFGEFGPI